MVLFADSAAGRLTFEIVERPAAEKRRKYGIAAAEGFLSIVFGPLTGLHSWPSEPMTRDVVATRRDTGEEVMRWPITGAQHWQVDQARGEMKRYSEAAWLDRWNSASKWGSAAQFG